LSALSEIDAGAFEVPFDDARDGGVSGARRVYGYMLLRYKRTWRGTLTTSFLYPLLYLLAMGLGLGHLVDQHLAGTSGSSGSSGLGPLGGVTYVQFIAPSLLAATAMQMGFSEATYPVMNGIKWGRVYFAMISAPIPVRHIQLGHLAWIATRLATAATVFLAIIAVFGDVRSAWALLAMPCAVLTGLAFASPMMAFTARQENDNVFSLVYRMGVIPLFLFSGTFFPLSQLPGWLQVVARMTPLYHGVALCRGLVNGNLGLLPGLVHAGYLVAMVVIGVAWARSTYPARMFQ
jgi:lipooligosaccharide transport system permease protein